MGGLGGSGEEGDDHGLGSCQVRLELLTKSVSTRTCAAMVVMAGVRVDSSSSISLGLGGAGLVFALPRLVGEADRDVGPE